MTADDTLYQLGDAIGWDRCDYARDTDDNIYGVTDGATTLGLTPHGECVYWQTSCRIDGETELLDDGACPMGDTQTLLGARQRATSLFGDGEAA